jgi:hypothetical protein
MHKAQQFSTKFSPSKSLCYNFSIHKRFVFKYTHGSTLVSVPVLGVEVLQRSGKPINTPFWANFEN